MSVSPANYHDIKRPAGDLAKIVKLIGDGRSADVLQTCCVPSRRMNSGGSFRGPTSTPPQVGYVSPP